MTITIDCRRKLKQLYRKRLRRTGRIFRITLKNIQNYIEELLKKQALHPSLDEILAPVRQDFEESGMNEDEILEFFEEVREEVWQEKQNAK